MVFLGWGGVGIKIKQPELQGKAARMFLGGGGGKIAGVFQGTAARMFLGEC